MTMVVPCVAPIPSRWHQVSIEVARWLSGRMSDCQSIEPMFKSPFAAVSKFGHIRSLHDSPVRSAV